MSSVVKPTNPNRSDASAACCSNCLGSLGCPQQFASCFFLGLCLALCAEVAELTISTSSAAIYPEREIGAWLAFPSAVQELLLLRRNCGCLWLAFPFALQDFSRGKLLLLRRNYGCHRLAFPCAVQDFSRGKLLLLRRNYGCHRLSDTSAVIVPAKVYGERCTLEPAGNLSSLY